MAQDVLAAICLDKQAHIERQKSLVPMAVLEQKIASLPPCRGFIQALRERQKAGQFGLIAEIKKASPSKGLIRADFDAATLAKTYQDAGATCLSILTDTAYFHGSDNDFAAARQASDLPLIRKDFILDPYQVYETRAMGADCLLLIMAALEDDVALMLYALARQLGLDVLVEVHNAEEAARALKLNPDMIGINNRNLKTLEIDLNVSCEISPTLPDHILRVGESGLYHRHDLDRLAHAGMTSFLVGESLMRQNDLATAVKNLLGDGQIR